MRRTILLLLVAAAGALASTAVSAESGVPSSAQTLRVAADIIPVKALADAVVGDRHAVDLIIGPEASAHNFSMRPSDARKLVHADLVILLGSRLPPWLKPTLEKIAPNTARAELQAVTQTAIAGDPHTWLDPQNAIHWLSVIADELALLVPENAAYYRQNAARAIEDIEQEVGNIRRQLDAMTRSRWLIYHDSLAWFSQRFGPNPVAVVFDADDQPPSPARFAHIRGLVRQGEVDCVLTEPGVSQRAIASLDDSGELRFVTVDPMGRSLPSGSDHYPALLRSISSAIQMCVPG